MDIVLNKTYRTKRKEKKGRKVYFLGVQDTDTLFAPFLLLCCTEPANISTQDITTDIGKREQFNQGEKAQAFGMQSGAFTFNKVPCDD